MDFVKSIDELLTECSTHWTTGSELLYPLRKMYPKGHNFAPYRVDKKFRTEPTKSDIRKFIRILQKMKDALDDDSYHHYDYYLQLQMERFCAFLTNKQIDKQLNF